MKKKMILFCVICLLFCARGEAQTTYSDSWVDSQFTTVFGAGMTDGCSIDECFGCDTCQYWRSDTEIVSPNYRSARANSGWQPGLARADVSLPLSDSDLGDYRTSTIHEKICLGGAPTIIGNTLFTIRIFSSAVNWKRDNPPGQVPCAFLKDCPDVTPRCPPWNVLVGDTEAECAKQYKLVFYLGAIIAGDTSCFPIGVGFNSDDAFACLE